MISHARLRRVAPAVALALAAIAPIGAIYMQPDLDNVPIDRLVQNLERAIAGNPRDSRLLLNLARTHAMAFAQKTGTVTVLKGAEASGAWYGFQPARVPTAVPTTDPAKLAAANAQLAKAIQRYEDVIRIDPANTIARVGLAWCVDQSGDKPRAVEQYRAILKDAWEREDSRRTGWGLEQPVTHEVVGYLIPLLDPVRDRAEIATWRERVAALERLPRAITPIAIPLRDGMDVRDVVDPRARVRFDADGSGVPRTWTWINKDAGWLVYDQQGTGRITSALQMFGSVTFWLFWADGYQALGALDDNRDGLLAGPELAHLAIWRDADQNGVSDRGEVRPLERWGIVSISCRSEPDESGLAAAWSPAGVTFSSGATRATYDVILHRR